jgi:hypothetical protein
MAIADISNAPNRDGCVYVMSTGDFVKIGFSARPRIRHANIQAGCPTPVKIEALASGTMEDEKHIHYCLRSAGISVRGEWYRRDDVLGVIERMKSDQIEEAILAAVEINRCRYWAKFVKARRKGEARA